MNLFTDSLQWKMVYSMFIALDEFEPEWVENGWIKISECLHSRIFICAFANDSERGINSSKGFNMV